MKTEEAFLKLGSSLKGLANEEAVKRLGTYGPNQLEEKNRITPFKVLIRQHANVIVWVLAAAAIIALLAGEVINFWAISGIILFVILMGFLLADPFADVQKARTLTFVTIVSMALFVPNAFRSLESSAITRGLFSNRSMLTGMLITFLLIVCVVYIPLLQLVFELTPLGLMDWVLPLGAAFLTLLIIEGIKFVMRGGKKEADII